ncbi:MAG: hypothetical protein Tsb009_12190 [Planctomycetaceae bacterium]
MRKIVNVQWLGVLGIALAGFMLINSQDEAQARPKYLKGFTSKYSNVADQAKKAKCGVCHFGRSKKNRNDYGKALMKNIKKNEKDAKAIDTALGKTEAAKNAKGVTFGSLIKAGKLPGTNPK